jgi:hypothetical protein
MSAILYRKHRPLKMTPRGLKFRLACFEQCLTPFILLISSSTVSTALPPPTWVVNPIKIKCGCENRKVDTYNPSKPLCTHNLDGCGYKRQVIDPIADPYPFDSSKENLLVS